MDSTIKTLSNDEIKEIEKKLAFCAQIIAARLTEIDELRTLLIEDYVRRTRVNENQL